MCPQGDGNDSTNSEDCLYLNVFTPLDAEYNVTSYQVMVWIHGGGFFAGSAFEGVFMYDPTYFMNREKDVIFVSINYRLGTLGFLYDYDLGTGIEGNFGLEDQMMAIQWVYDHIASGIMQSPSLHLISSNMSPEQHEGNAILMSDTLGCNSSSLDASELLDCWRSADWE